MSVFVTIACPSCPRDLRVRREHVGRRVVCKFCSSVFRVPTHLDIPCPECGQEGTVRAEHLGRKIRCKTCMHVFRARIKAPVGRTRSDLEVVRLLGEIDRRERQLSALRGQLDEARVKLVTLDSRARSLTDSRDLSQRTEEYSTFDEPAASGSSCGTDPDLPLADLDSSEADEPRTRVEPPSQSGRVRDDELTHTRLAEWDTELEKIREERDRLRKELDRLHEASERTVITRDRTEILECELAVARADNVRLATERARRFAGRPRVS